MAPEEKESFVGPLVEESWKKIEGASFYEVSNLGRIRSSTERYKNKKRILKSVKNNNGYCVVDLRGTPLKQNKLVHRLVAEAFLQPPSGEIITECLRVGIEPFINHKNGRRDDNRVCNLEWCTPSYNNAVENKKSTKGENAPVHVLTPDDVIEILAYGMCNYSYKEIASIFNVAVTTISNIFNGYAWSHLSGIPRRDRKDRPPKTKALSCQEESHEH